MGAPCSPIALRLLLLALIGCCPGCQAAVQVSVPAEIEVLLGHRVSIPCTHTVTGNPSYRLVEWFITDKGGERRRVAYSEEGPGKADGGTEYTDRISMSPDASLVITAADVNDERAFSCQVTAGAAGSGEGVAQLKVYDPPEAPELIVNVRTLSVTDSSVSEIATCISRNANPLPTISWYKDGVHLPAPTEQNNDLYVVSRTVKEASGLHSVSSALYLRPVKADKDSRFYCQVQYLMPQGRKERAMSELFNLTLHYYTEHVNFSLERPSVIKEGDDVRLRCQGDGNPPPEYVFTKKQNSQPVDLGANPEGLLILPRVSKSDSGTYQCQVLDFDSPPEVELEKEVSIYVNYLDPLVLTPSKTVTVAKGDDIELSCIGTGSQSPKLSWRKGKERVSHGGTLALQSLTYHAAGAYTCEASVPSIPGLQRDQTVRVIVQGKPELEQRHDQTYYHGLSQTVKLTCSALGHPEPQISWNISGVEPTVRSAGNRVISELTVELTPELAQAGVKCRAQNQFGSAEQTFQLQIAPTPAPSASPGPVVDGGESQEGSTAAVIAVCVCVLLLLLIVGFFYIMQRRGHLPCGSGEKRSLTPKEGNPDDTVVEMKTDKRNEQTGLLSPGGAGGGGGHEC